MRWIATTGYTTLLALSLVACGGGSSGGDAGDAASGDIAALDVPLDAPGDAVLDVPAEGGEDARADALVACTTDRDCDDGVFCNGLERCTPGGVGVDARGCALGASPCSVMQTCDEAHATCVSASCMTPDVDGDGHRAIACGGDDCDDNDPHRFPGNTEVCAVMMAAGADGGVTAVRVDPAHDEDCDPTTYANAATHDGDQDGDGYIDRACCNTDRSGMTICGTDCADLAPVVGFASTLMLSVAPAQIHPTEPEVCNGVDDNCNGTTDEGVSGTYYRDCDGDGFGDPADAGMAACLPRQLVACMGHDPVQNNTDCDDARGDVHPGATEVCDGADNNCNGATDEGGAAPRAWYRDADGDGFGAIGVTMTACSPPAGYVALGTDCNDANGSVNPAAFERCNGVDDNCNGTVDEGCMCTDGATRPCGTSSVGVCRMGTQQCIAGTWASCAGDVEPASMEVCDGLDNNCNGRVDEGVSVTCYADSDGDGFGTGATVTRCLDASRGAFGNCPVGYAPVAGDCNDSNAGAHPMAMEVCNGIDDDCDGTIDDGVQLTLYVDSDHDGYGQTGMTRTGCAAATGLALVGGDCNDANPNVHPGQPEVCNGVDDNCNGATDEGVQTTFYRDADGDLYGATASTMMACSPPVGYVATPGDCNDANPAVHPGAVEVCNGIDDNCSGGPPDEPPATTNCAGSNPGAAHVATWACAGSCSVGTCAAGFGDCDGNATNGCETDLSSTAAHCGSCASACGPGASCHASTCDTIASLAAGGATTCVTWSSGRVACWGAGGSGQLDDPSLGDHASPYVLPDAVGVGFVALTHGDIDEGQICAGSPTNGSSVECWGRNDGYQVGDGTRNVRYQPQVVVPNVGAGSTSSFGLGREHSCVAATNSVYCWGENLHGELGFAPNGSFTAPLYVATPPMSGGNGFLGYGNSVAAGVYFTCYRDLSGNVHCAGNNSYGVLGNGVEGGPDSYSFAATVTSSAVSVWAGDDHVCALRSVAPTLQCWGDGTSGQLGNGGTSASGSPVAVPVPAGSTSWTQVALGSSSTCGLTDTQRVYCWGSNGLGALGSNTGGAPAPSPTLVGSLSGVTRIAAGTNHACAVSGTHVYCWGYNGRGQLGLGTTDTTAHPTPTLVNGF